MKKWIVIGLLLVVTFYVVRTLYRGGTFKTINGHLEGTLVNMYENVPGTEDMDIDYKNKILYISSSDRWKFRNAESVDDGIWKINLDSIGAPQKMLTDFSAQFHPHGISFISRDSVSQLFVVNHNSEGHSVEVFEIKGDSLKRIRSYTNAMMSSPNDVVAVDFETFYVTNDHGQTSGFLKTAEEYLQIPWSYLLYHNGTHFDKVWTGVNYANGVNISRDGKKLFLATTTGRSLITFARNPDGTLNQENELNLNTGIDNISVDADGNLWIAAHPKMLAFVSHSKNPAKHSPSQVLKLTPDALGGYAVKEIYLDDGQQLSGSSVTVRYNNDIFVGVVFESKILLAHIPDQE